MTHTCVFRGGGGCRLCQLLQSLQYMLHGQEVRMTHKSTIRLHYKIVIICQDHRHHQWFQQLHYFARRRIVLVTHHRLLVRERANDKPNLAVNRAGYIEKYADKLLSPSPLRFWFTWKIQKRTGNNSSQWGNCGGGDRDEVVSGWGWEWGVGVISKGEEKLVPLCQNNVCVSI